jgi:hypothetical protein
MWERVLDKAYKAGAMKIFTEIPRGGLSVEMLKAY